MVFSDEKKWNLDGPDGMAYYWRHVPSEPRYFSKRQAGGKSLMVWAAFSSHGKSRLCFVNGRLDSVAYQEVLENFLLPYMEETNVPNLRFQQDNAPIHVSHRRPGNTMEWFRDHEMVPLPWPACSPDCNPIENLWGIMVRHVYHNARQFQTVNELKTAIQEAWDSIEPPLLQKLSNSMPNRIAKLLQNNGSTINY